MANRLYTTGKTEILKGNVDFENDTIGAVLVDTDDYTVDTTNHQHLDDIPSAARVATGTLANTSVTSAVFDADDLTFTSVTGDQSEAVVLYKDTGSASTSQLLVFIDSATGLPVTPNGGDITVQWDDGVNKIFSL